MMGKTNAGNTRSNRLPPETYTSVGQSITSFFLVPVSGME